MSLWWVQITKSTLRPVQAGERIGSLWLIDSGLNPGEKVIVEGLQKVREGVDRKTHRSGNPGNDSPTAPPASAT